MKLVSLILVPTMLFCAHVTTSLATDSSDPISGLPVAPNSKKTSDPVQSYKYCGKNAQADAYFYSGADKEDEDLVATAKAWYVKAMPHASVYNATGGLVTLVTADGTAAVVLAGVIISFVHFSPGLSPAEMQGLGSAPASRECQA
jgi:hypothetical protein